MENKLLHTIKITGVTHQGKGVGRISNKVVFVDGALPGEELEIYLTKANKNYCEARIENILVPSQERIKPTCPMYLRCGGCTYLHAAYEEEVKLKTRIVRETLKKIAGVNEDVILECLHSPQTEFYRNKIQYSTGKIDGKIHLGFIDKDFHFFPLTECKLSDFEISKWAAVIEKNIPEEVTRVIIRKSYPEGKMLCLLLSPQKINLSEKAVAEIMDFPQAAALFSNITDPNAPDIPGISTCKIAGEDYLTEKIKDFSFAVGPLSFFQVNPYQTPNLYDIALGFLPEGKKVLDLFCGVGSITLFAALKAEKTVGIEISSEAIYYAKQNAALNAVGGTEFYAGNVENMMNRYQEDFSTIILDPPRRGCAKKVLEHVASKTKRIIYVSCESSTLARDLKILKEYGFEVQKVVPVDMFPRTARVECVIMMMRSGSDDKK